MSSGGLLEQSRRPAVVLDVAVAVALTAGALWAVTTLRHDATVPVTVAAAVACTGAVGWRRIAPVPAALVALTAVLAYQLSGQDTQGVFVSISVVLTCYTVGRSVTSPLQLLGVAAYALAVVTGIDVDAGFSAGQLVLTWLPLMVAPIAGGMFVARRAGQVRRLRAARARLRDEQDIARTRAVAEERTRVARELHDVVAHCVSVMVIQAGAARLLASLDVSAARGAMRAVGASGREALADLRRIVGARRHTDDATLSTATLGLDQVPQLVERTRAAGVPVRLRLTAAVALPSDIDLAAFRIVQEALTNVCKHAPAASVDVHVTVNAETAEVAVVDSGPAQPTAVAGSGHGLAGMRERVALHGGELMTGPTASGGFAVRARLPLAAPASAPIADESNEGVARRWPRLSPVQLDVLFSLAWLAVLEIDAATSRHRAGSLALNLIVVAALALAGVFRRRAPLGFLVAVGLLDLALSGGIAAPQRVSAVSAYVLFVGAYTIGAYCARGRAFAGLGLLLAGTIGVTVGRHASAGVALGGASTATAVWLVGRIVRDQRDLLAELRAATARLNAELEQRALIALHEERVRIARDLHTIVARLVTTMVVQAEAAGDLLSRDPRGAVEAITTIEDTGRQALVQLRQILGVLRNRLDPAPRRPHLDHAESMPDELLTVPS